MNIVKGVRNTACAFFVFVLVLPVIFVGGFFVSGFILVALSVVPVGCFATALYSLAFKVQPQKNLIPYRYRLIYFEDIEENITDLSTFVSKSKPAVKISLVG